MVAEQTDVVMLAGILGYAAFTDVRWHKIPNALSLGGCVAGILFHVLRTGAEGLLLSSAGAGIGLCLFLPLHIFASMGAGDVKLMCAVGAFVGPGVVVYAAFASIIAGGLLGIATIIAAGELPKFCARNARFLRQLVMTRTIDYVPPAPGDAAGRRMPFAPAIALGTLAALWYLGQLDGAQRLV